MSGNLAIRLRRTMRVGLESDRFLLLLWRQHVASHTMPPPGDHGFARCRMTQGRILTQTSPRKGFPTGAKEAQSHLRQKR